MNRVLVLYPAEFKCQSKFDRKLTKILSNLDEYLLVCMLGQQQLIESYVSSYGSISGYEAIKSLAEAQATHAVIFDDGINFQDIIIALSTTNIPIRRIKVDITRVINIKRQPEYKSIEDSASYQYIGRGSYWGNPYAIGEDGDREEVIRRFAYDFEYDKFPYKTKKESLLLRGKTLGCFCKPDKCHGDILADYLNSYDDGQ